MAAVLGAVLALATPPCSAQSLGDVRQLAMSGQLDAARARLEAARKAGKDLPTVLEARSWIARGELARRKYDRALAEADGTYGEAEALLAARPLDAEKHLPTALGAAIEVHAQATAAEGERDHAVEYLRAELKRFQRTSIAARIQKNLHLLALEGRPAPPLATSEVLGPPIPPGTERRPRLYFFWAHWCPDCKATAPIVARLKKELGPRGLVVVAPTRPYGFVAGGAEATVAEERPYIEGVRRREYPSIVDVPAPFGEDNFRAWGASTVPTLALVDAEGVVRLYHPGAMSYEELEARARGLLKP